MIPSRVVRGGIIDPVLRFDAPRAPLSCSRERVSRTFVVRAICVPLGAVGALLMAGCGDLPSKGDALEAVKQGVKEEATCTLPVAVFSAFKIQHATKAVCVSREGPSANVAAACLEALVAAGTTRRMPASYMAQWPDELTGAGFDSVSPYDRRARDLLFKGCVEMVPGLREGQFKCGQAEADKIIRMTKSDEDHAVVRYTRAVSVDAHVASIEAACGAVTRPAPEGSVTFARTAEKKWVMAGSGAAQAGGPSSASR